MRKTIKKVMIVVPVLMTSCQVSLNPKSGPVTAHAATTETAIMKVTGLPVILAVNFAKRENQDFDLVGLISAPRTFKILTNSYHMQFRLGDSLSSVDLPYRQG